MLKVSCYRNYCIDFNQILHNDRDHQVVIVGGHNCAQLIQDGGGCHLEKSQKLRYLCKGLTDPYEILFGNSNNNNINISKIVKIG